MALRHLSGRGLAAVLAAGLLAVGCTPESGQTPTVSPTPGTQTSPTATPTPTRTETAEEQKQREAFEAAEKAYRTGFREAGRLAVDGGTEKPTRILRATMTGRYLSVQMDQLRAFKAEGLHASSIAVIGWVRREAYSEQTLRLEVCEDYRDVHLIMESGATEPPDEAAGTRVYRQVITVTQDQGQWKTSDFETVEDLKDCGV